MQCTFNGISVTTTKWSDFFGIATEIVFYDCGKKLSVFGESNVEELAKQYAIK